MNSQSLYDAAEKGDSVLLKELIEKVESSEWENIQKDKLLFGAVSNGHHDCLEVLLKLCSLEDIVGSNHFSEASGYRTPLDVALFQADWKMVELLIGLYPETSTARETGFLLHNACNGKDLKIIEVLLKRFPDHVHEKDIFGDFPIHCAACHCNSHIIDALLKAGADVNIKRKSDGITPLHLVCRYGNLANVKHILNMTSDINVQGKSGATLLSYAARNDQLDIVTLLLAKGADPAISSPRIYRPRYPLAVAVTYGRLEIVKALADLTPNEGRSEAIREVIRNDSVDCLEYMISEGFSLPLSEDLIHDDGFIKVDFKKDTSRTMKILLENGLPISELMRYTGWSVTTELLCRSNNDTLKVLLDFGWLESFWMKSNEGFLTELLFKAGAFLLEMVKGNMEHDSEDGESEDEHDGSDGESVDTGMNDILSNFLLLQNYYPFINFFEYNPRSPEDILTMDYLHPVVPKLSEICRWVIRCRIISKYGILSRDHVQGLPLPKPLKVMVIPDEG